MGLPTINLDDRTWDQLVQSAKAKIPGLCPQWTDFNPSDPGITLVEQMAWMAEMLLYRLNIVPEKNYFKFLELIGITPTPPAAASTPVTFSEQNPKEDSPLPIIPENTILCGSDETGQDIQFITTEPLSMVRTKLEGLFIQSQEFYSDCFPNLGGDFACDLINAVKKKPVPHVFFMGDPQLANLGGDVALTLLVDIEKCSKYPLPLIWSGWNGSQWTPIPTANIEDHTHGLTCSGRILFKNFPALSPCQVYGYNSYWLRVDLGTTTPDQLPLLRAIKMIIEIPMMIWAVSETTPDSSESGNSFQWLLSYNEFEFNLIKDKEPFQPFVPVSLDQPQCYLKFSLPLVGKTPFPHPMNAIYFQLEDSPTSQEVQIIWEYHNPHGWKPLEPLADSTRHFTRSGRLLFAQPNDWTVSKSFGEWGFWLRVRWEKYDHKHPPKLFDIRVNTVAAIHACCHPDEILGSSNGSIFQWFRFKHFPFVKNSFPPRILIQEEAPDPATGAVKFQWVEWQEQENFYYSNRDSRHYILDHTNGKITFGDGIKGKIPPKGTNNIKCQHYYTGGGQRGNIDRFALTHLANPASMAQPLSLANYYHATGGLDSETLEDAKLRAANVLKSCHRAVTATDIETLALNSSSRVYRATCRADQETGLINVIILPKPQGDPQQKPVASDELCQTVQNHLDRQRLITSRIAISSPSYKEFSINATIRLKERTKHNTAALRETICDNLNRFFSPYLGGADRNGYPMGRPVYISEIYYIIEDVDGIDYVENLALSDSSSPNGLFLETIEPKETEFAFLGSPIKLVFLGG